MSSGDSSSESVRAAGQPTEEKAERRKVSHRSLRRETVQVQGPGEGKRCHKIGDRLSPAVASSSSVAASSVHFSSATFSRRASSLLMYSSSS